MLDSFDILTAAVVGIVVGLAMLPIGLLVRLQLVRRRYQAQKLAQAEQYADLLATTYSQIGDCEVGIHHHAELYRQENGNVGLAITLLLTEVDAGCVQHQPGGSRAALEGWANRVVTGAGIGLREQDYRITLTSPRTPLVTISHERGGQTQVVLTSQHAADFGE